jgi:hypothetical protein
LSSDTSKPLLSNSAYDIFKKAVTVALPGVGTLYFTLSQIWHLPYGEEVVGTVAALNLFLGLLLHGSSRAYSNSDAQYDGTIEVAEEEDKKTLSLSFDEDQDPDTLSGKNKVTFKVEHK